MNATSGNGREASGHSDPCVREITVSREKNELPYNGRSAPLNIPGMEPGSGSLANRYAHAGFRSDDFRCDPASFPAARFTTA